MKIKKGFPILRKFSKFTNYAGGGLHFEWKKHPGSSRMLDGFTIVELLISLAIMSVLITILAELFGSILSLRQKSETVSSIAQDSRYILLRLSYDLARSSTIVSPVPGASASALSLVIDGTSYIYSESGGVLSLSVGGGASSVLNSPSTSLSNFSFTGNQALGDSQSIGLSFTISPTSEAINSAPVSRQVTTTLVSRQPI
jgi:prepilin-type N-terminal cleavage/methylation domain-containing protein